MENDGVIEKVNQPTDRINSLVFRRKANGKMPVSLDPRDLDKAKRREYYRTPVTTLEEISHKFSGAKRFSKLNAKKFHNNADQIFIAHHPTTTPKHNPRQKRRRPNIYSEL